MPAECRIPVTLVTTSVSNNFESNSQTLVDGTPAVLLHDCMFYLPSTAAGGVSSLIRVLIGPWHL